RLTGGIGIKPLVYAVVGGDADARAEGVSAADLETIVLHHVELVGERIDRGIAEPRVIVPAEAALVERHRSGEEHGKLPADDRGRVPLGGGVAGQRDAVAVQADLDPLDLVRRQIVLPAHRNQRIERGVGIAATWIGLYTDLERLIGLAEAGGRLLGMGIVAVADQQPVFAFDRFGRADKLVARQCGGDYAVHCGGADLIALVPG